MTYYLLLSNQLGLSFVAADMTTALTHFQHWFNGFALASSDHPDVTDISTTKRRGAQYFETAQVREIAAFLSISVARPEVE
jgi:hypothetical protein